MTLLDRITRSVSRRIPEHGHYRAGEYYTPPVEPHMAPDPQDRDETSAEHIHRPTSISQPIIDPEFVTRMVSAVDGGNGISRSGGSSNAKNRGYMHVTGLLDVCPREHTLSYQQGLPIGTTVVGAMKIVWAIGRAVEKHIRNNVIMNRGWKGIYGLWWCRCHLTSHLGTHPADKVCRRCGGGINTYNEPLLEDHDNGIIGCPDLTLVELGWFIVVETKSMNKTDFDKLDAPLADHVMQALMYRHLYAEAGFPVTDYVIIVYARKDFIFGGSRAIYKEYHVRVDNWQGHLSRMVETGRSILDANKQGRILPRVLCSTATCSRAKGCSRVTSCFSQ